jgi:hypothetical protein
MPIEWCRIRFGLSSMVSNLLNYLGIWVGAGEPILQCVHEALNYLCSTLLHNSDLIEIQLFVSRFRFEMLDTTLLSSSIVSSLVPRGLLIKYFVRADKLGFFHTYPDRGGPFKSILEAQEAIDSYHVVQRKIM